MIERFENEMTSVEKLIRKKMAWRGLVNSVSQTIPYFAYAGGLYYGAFMIAAEEIHFKNVIKLVKAHSNIETCNNIEYEAMLHCSMYHAPYGTPYLRLHKSACGNR